MAAQPPLDEYRQRQANWTKQQEREQRLFINLGNWRLIVAVLSLVLAWFIFGKHAISPWSLGIPLVAFLALVVWHQRVLRRRTFAERAIRFYQQAMNRVQDTWHGNGNPGNQFRDTNHIYSDDLDVFGKGSLFELLSTARTVAGEEMLARWLLSPATIQEASERQQAVHELAPKLDLREEMALLGEDIKSSVNAETLSTWGTAPLVPFPAALRAAALGLSILGLILLILKLADLLPLWPLLAIVVINIVLMLRFRKPMGASSEAIEAAAHKLSLLSLLIERLEAEQFTSPLLTNLRDRLTTDTVPASKSIKRLDRWLELLDSSDHVLVRILDLIILYKLQVVMAIESWRAQNGASIGHWIQALAEFEALSSFGALNYEHATWSFPSLDTAPDPNFSASALGHPLIPASTSVRNNVELNGQCRLLIVSGSNMSGKSTLLRAVGLNAVLAWAGAPVCAEGLHLSRLQVGASLRVSDSLQDNRSRFFAEISRLRQIVDLTNGTIPVLFLLDELLSGTNSHDRRIGAAGVVRGLLAAQTIGMLTTHDLALAQLENELGFTAKNVHFEDRITAAGIEFDYHLRPGVVTHSNALALMRSIGLKI